MKPIQTALSLTLAFVALTAAVSARAALQAMPDEELREFQGAMGVPGLAAVPWARSALGTLPLPLSLPGSEWPQGGPGGRVLTPAQFQATLAESGIVDPGMTPGPAQPVFELPLTLKPGPYTLAASQVFAPLGLMPHLPGLGSLRVVDLNTEGSRLWIWSH